MVCSLSFINLVWSKQRIQIILELRIELIVRNLNVLRLNKERFVKYRIN